MEIFRCVGRCLEAEDKLMDAVTSLNGSGPAFAYIILEALADGGVRMGLRRDTAMEIAAQMFQGAARMVLQTGMHPAALKDQVTTPAGSTIAGLLTMEDGRIRSVIARAVEEAAHVAASSGRASATVRRRVSTSRAALRRRPGEPGQPDGHGDRPRHRQHHLRRDPVAEGRARAAQRGCAGWASALALILRIGAPADAVAGSWA